MNPSDLTSRRRVLVAVIAAAVLLLVIVGVGVYGLIRGPQTTTPSADDAVTLTPGPSGSSGTSATPRPVYDTTDGEAFAHSVAVALFTWDTTGSHGPSDYAQVLVDVGDPTGNETSELASDVRSYLPSPEAWAQLRTHQTRQWITIDSIEVPDAWADAEAQAAPGQLLPGTTAYTITGTRHRAGIWGTEPMQTERPVAFTVFVACEPSFDACRLLRLSQVDNPLH